MTEMSIPVRAGVQMKFDNRRDGNKTTQVSS